MKLVILGAGASFDSIYEYHDNSKVNIWRPPLGNELFTPRENFRTIFSRYPGVQSLIAKLNSVENIELFFQELWDLATISESADLAAELINIQFCLQDLMINITKNNKDVGLSNYDLLMHDAFMYTLKTDEDVIFVTFNYDLLLEDSFTRVVLNNRSITSVDDYINSKIKIIKPHGSCNWHRKMESIPEDIRMRHDHWLFNSKKPFAFVDDNSQGDFIIKENFYINNLNTSEYFFPQLLIPFQSKDAFVLPKTHLEELSKNLEKVTDILIVGWKGAEDNFNNLLKEKIGNRKVKLTIVNGGNDDIRENIENVLFNKEFNFFYSDYHLTRYNNTLLGINGKTESYEIYHTRGSFSSYMLNVTKGKFQNFFLKE